MTEPVDSYPIPIEQLCDPANWSRVSEPLEPLAWPTPAGADNVLDVMLLTPQHYRMKRCLSASHPLAILAAPADLYRLGERRISILERSHLQVHSFGVDREQFALIDPESYRRHDRGDGWAASFNYPSPGVLVTFEASPFPGAAEPEGTS